MTAASMTGIRRPQPAATQAPDTHRLPWQVGDLLRVAGLNGAVAVALLVAWSGTGGTALLSDAVTWTVVGIGAIVVQGCANAGWLLRGRRAVGERRARLLEDLEQLPEVAALSATGAPAALAAGAISVQASAAQGDLLAVEGAIRYHRPSCQLVQGKSVVAAPVGHHLAASRTACGVCEA